jgi:hypothetical protein
VYRKGWPPLNQLSSDRGKQFRRSSSIALAPFEEKAGTELVALERGLC